MDAEEIAKLVEGLRVSAEARERVVMISSEKAARGQKRIERVVVGKIFSKKTVNRETLRANLPRILRSRGTTEIEIVGHNLFVISFALESDKRVALEEGPWHFFQELMILQQTKAMQTPSEVEFDEISLWVQCHNVPLECMDPEIIRRIGGRIGKVEEVDVGEGGSCLGKFARVRVRRRIDEPLVRCVPLVHETTQKEGLVVLQYERLPEFCFICGRVGHISRDCWEANGERVEFRYDSWLRAGRSFLERRNSDNEERGVWKPRGGRGREEREQSREDEGRKPAVNGRAGTIGLGEEKGGGVGEREESEGGGEREEGEGGGENAGEGLLKEDLMAVEEEGLAVDGSSEEDMALVVLDQGGGSETNKMDRRLSTSPPLKDPDQIKKKGKGWKRLAREKKGQRGGEQVDIERDVGRRVGVKRRGGVLEKGGGEEGSTQKLMKLSDEMASSNVLSAVAAAQPRRAL